MFCGCSNELFVAESRSMRESVSLVIFSSAATMRLGVFKLDLERMRFHGEPGNVSRANECSALPHSSA